MSQKEQTPQRPGWYDDPDGVYEHQAYWDGIKWTGRTRPPQAKVATAVSTSIGVLVGSAFYIGVMAATGDRDLAGWSEVIVLPVMAISFLLLRRNKSAKASTPIAFLVLAFAVPIWFVALIVWG